MKIGDYGYQKTEWLKIAEQIYEYKERKKELELQLSSEKFHYDYLPKRKKLLRDRAAAQLFLIIILTSIFVACLVLIFAAPEMFTGEGGVFLLGIAIYMFFGGYVDVKLIRQEAEMLSLFFFSRSNSRALRFAQKHNINTFQSDEYKSQQRLGMLENEIAAIEENIASLTEKQQQLLVEREQREDVLRKKGILFDENPDKKETAGKFSLREDSMGAEDARQWHEYYLKEEQYINEHLMQMDVRLQQINKEIVEIDENFEKVKKNLLFSLFVFIIIILVQGSFTGGLSVITSFFCFVGGLIYIFYLESKCTRPILLYLVENDSDLTREYAFRNNIAPVKNKRVELLEEIENEKKEIVKVREKRDAIVF